jgi:hypothetical protein
MNLEICSFELQHTGLVNAIDIEALSNSNCEYITPEDCPTDWVALSAFDEKTECMMRPVDCNQQTVW